MKTEEGKKKKREKREKKLVVCLSSECSVYKNFTRRSRRVLTDVQKVLGGLLQRILNSWLR